MLKKNYSKPGISLLPTKCHISTIRHEEPEDIDRNRRSLLIKGGLLATVGHITLYGGSGSDVGPDSVVNSQQFNLYQQSVYDE